MDDGDEVQPQVQMVEDFAVFPGEVGGVPLVEGVDVLVGFDVVQVPFGVGEVARQVRGGVVPRVLAQDLPGLRVVDVTVGEQGCGAVVGEGRNTGRPLLVCDGVGHGACADGGQLVGDAAQLPLPAFDLRIGFDFPREGDAGGVVGGVSSIVGQVGEVEAGVDDGQAGPLLGGIPGERVDAVAFPDGLAFVLLHAQREQFLAGPVAELVLDVGRVHGFRIGGAAVGGVGVFGAVHGDGLLASQEGGGGGGPPHRGG